MSTYELVKQLMHKSRHLFRSNLNHIGLYRGQPKFLFMLAHHDGMTKKEISEHLDIAAPTVTKTVERLCSRGCVRTEKDSEDKRVTRVYITDEGKSLLKHLKGFEREYEAVMTKGIDKEEMVEFNKTLLKIIENIDRYREESNEKDV